jgi:hypothetical protein
MTIELGVVVVYMVGDGNEGLLDLHLDRLERHTTVPYSIHGSVNRLASRCRETLERRPRVHLHELPPTPLRGTEEHSYYLDRLVTLAIADGATHIVVLHVDSFPIRDGWAEDLAGRLSRSCVFVTLEEINTACLFFTRDFYLQHRPPFLVSPEQRRTSAYRAFTRSADLILRSGTGFGFEAYRNGLSWCSLSKSSSDESGRAGIYDDLLFHLGGALSLTAQLREAPPSSRAPSAGLPSYLERLGVSRFESCLRSARAVLPPRLREHMRSRLGRAFERLIDEPRVRWHVAERNRLLADPESFIESMRG